MNINRNNYEEYFLLYADNELSRTERKVVEIFVQENADLKEEFLMIQLTVNIPEKDVTLSDKSFLLKKEPSFIDKDNCEEIFVLYHDNELSDDQKRETENFVVENLKYKDDFELTGMAKLIPENFVIYPDKKKLYRKEKPGKIIPLILWRSLAAAVFIGFGLWASVAYYTKNETSSPAAIVTHNSPQKPKINETEPQRPVVAHEPDEDKSSVVASTKSEPPARKKGNEKRLENTVFKEQNSGEESIAEKDTKTEDQSLRQTLKGSKQPDDAYQLATSDKSPKELPSIIEKPEISLPDNQIEMKQNKIGRDAGKVAYTQTISFVSDPEVNNQNYVFYDVSAEEFSKSKVGGFLKKVKRIVERTNPITRFFNGDEAQIAAK